jgi:DNA-binding FrmR family transcriptional regulator
MSRPSGEESESECALHTERESEEKARLQARLKRIEGQIKGLQRMVDEDRYCVDILGQIASVHEALRGVGKQLLRGHLAHCVTEALRSGDDAEAERTYGELMDVIYKYTR